MGGFAIWRSIRTTQGYVAWVDQCDYQRLSGFRWYPSGAKAYAVRVLPKSLGGGSVYMHRDIMEIPEGMEELDHINGNGFDNRRCNLRPCTKAQNQHNKRPQAGTSRHKGVYWNSRLSKWHAQIKVSGQTVYLGLFTNEDEAGRAYDVAARKHFGEFARPNFAEVEA